MIPEGFPNSLGLMNLGGGDMLSLLMQFSFFGVLFFTSVSLLVSFLHLVWYGTEPAKNYISLVVFLVVSVPLFLFAYSLMPELAFKLNI